MEELSYGEARRRFWEMAYCAALAAGFEALRVAEDALADWEKRWVIVGAAEESGQYQS